MTGQPEPSTAIETPLWRWPKATRREALRPFVGHEVRLERWYDRTPSHGDRIYRGTLIAVAVSTIGSSADLAIIQEEDTTWAISVAQIASIRLAKASTGS